MRNKILYLLAFFAVSILAKADDGYSERVFVRTDKDCYVAGENIWAKFTVTDGTLNPSRLSKVGYIEISDVQRPFVRVKLALEAGTGIGKLKIPIDIPSGVYQMLAYTQYMRNEGVNVFFKKQLAIINPSIPAEPEKATVVDVKTAPQARSQANTISVSTDNKEYATRSKINLTLNGLPSNIADLTVSVAKKDSPADISFLVKPDELAILRTNTGIHPPFEYLPEYEGHILIGSLDPEPTDSAFIASLGFVGNNISYMRGQRVENKNEIRFFSKGVYGKQQVVTTAVSQFYDLISSRLNLISPFCEILPEKLPVLRIYDDKETLSERYIAAQLSETIKLDTLSNQIPFEKYYNITPTSSYDLDEYTRFSTLGETIFEFITFVRVSRINKERRIRVFTLEAERYNRGNTLVLLDGAPIYDHEFVLNYNPYLIKRVNIYGGRFTFSGEVFESIVSFVSKEENLPGFRLDTSAQMFEYECPELPANFHSSDYSEENNARIPDYRNTLFWEPFQLLPAATTVSRQFYSSDIKGTFTVNVEGFTTDGKIISGYAEFDVK
ncbi:MAG: hypothetical protein LBR13_03655 [Dysgonamonadaceae bacterium]|nr:hypothetical protein [Dysgonamonadaceae bacterium]